VTANDTSRKQLAAYQAEADRVPKPSKEAQGRSASARGPCKGRSGPFFFSLRGCGLDSKPFLLVVRYRSSRRLPRPESPSHALGIQKRRAISYHHWVLRLTLVRIEADPHARGVPLRKALFSMASFGCIDYKHWLGDGKNLEGGLGRPSTISSHGANLCRPCSVCGAYLVAAPGRRPIATCSGRLIAVMGSPDA